MNNLAWIFSLHVPFNLAVDLEASIVGCTELHCPRAEDLNPLCRVANYTSTVIGLTNLKSPVSETELTWTKGVKNFQDADIDPSSITYENNFYLGTPAGFDLSADATKSNYDACALFFVRLFDRVKFRGENTSTTSGTCSDVMTTNCLDAILKQAAHVVITTKGSSVADKCQALESHFSDHLISQRFPFATGRNWNEIVVRGTSC